LSSSLGSKKGVILVQIVVWILVRIVAGSHPDNTLELPDRKAQGFLVPIVLKRLLPEYAHKVFGEMFVRI
jgi:hypothetical protein